MSSTSFFMPDGTPFVDGASTPNAVGSQAMEAGESNYPPSSSMGLPSSTTCGLYQNVAGKGLSTESTTTADTNVGTFASPPKKSNAETSEGPSWSSMVAFLSRQKNSLNCIAASFSRKLLVGLLNVGLRAKRFLTGKNPAPAPVYDIVNAGPRHRFCTPNLVVSNCLGLGFGCGPDKFVTVAKVMGGIDLSFEASQRTVREYRESNPKIVRLWARLDQELKDRDGTSWCVPFPINKKSTISPDWKRWLIYRKIDSEMQTCVIAGREEYTYGGKLTENLVQGTARDILAEAWLRCAGAGYPPVLSVHDELVFEVPLESAEADLVKIKALMETPIAWAPELPIATDAHLAAAYEK